jgi:hypothetical protein
MYFTIPELFLLGGYLMVAVDHVQGSHPEYSQHAKRSQYEFGRAVPRILKDDIFDVER